MIDTTPSALTPEEIETITKLEDCPDCGGPILNGPYGETRESFTCGSCQMDFQIILDTPFGEMLAGPVQSGRRMGVNPQRAAFYDPECPERNCDACGKVYRGPSLYCCVRCAIDDA